MFVSIIIPTRNAAGTLEACLKSIKMQSYSNVEVIITDNYSKDETREIGREHGAKVMICGPRPPHNNFFTAPTQRRIGAQHATGDFLFFVDADMVLEQKLIKECLEKCIDGADAIAIPEVSFGNGFWSECKIAERKCYFEQSLSDQTIQACRFIERSAYESVGGWNESVGCFDDWDITMELRKHGFKIRLSDNRIFHNEGYLKLSKIIRKKYNMGKGANFLNYLSSGGKSFGTVSNQLTPLRIVRLLWKLPKVSRKISVIFGVVFMKLVEGIAFIVGLASSKVTH
jgi:glycosyltransferase involved in cell wall biosynthesis